MSTADNYLAGVKKLQVTSHSGGASAPCSQPNAGVATLSNMGPLVPVGKASGFNEAVAEGVPELIMSVSGDSGRDLGTHN